MSEEANTLKNLEYKGKPLRRSGNNIYYGNFEDTHIIFLQILSSVATNDEEIADKVNVQLLSNNTSLAPAARIIREGTRNGLYNAMEIGAIWLERALAE
ncbi:MAG: hypothetical protein FWG21_05135 [Oscillospiraceae bacterium]|nr:hypothetical protein [Oscillospiraceae bacterium]